MIASAIMFVIVFSLSNGIIEAMDCGEVTLPQSWVNDLTDTDCYNIAQALELATRTQLCVFVTNDDWVGINPVYRPIALEMVEDFEQDERIWSQHELFDD